MGRVSPKHSFDDRIRRALSLSARSAASKNTLSERTSSEYLRPVPVFIGASLFKEPILYILSAAT